MFITESEIGMKDVLLLVKPTFYRPTPFENTLTILKDPSNERELYLIGTTNSSTLLAKRTRDIIRNEKPDTVYVQTNERWWNLIKDFKNVNSQKELNLYNPVLRDTQEWHMENNPRSLIFKLRFYPWMFVLTQMFGMIIIIGVI